MMVAALAVLDQAADYSAGLYACGDRPGKRRSRMHSAAQPFAPAPFVKQARRLFV
jgi:hypothetical protein